MAIYYKNKSSRKTEAFRSYDFEGHEVPAHEVISHIIKELNYNPRNDCVELTLCGSNTGNQ